MWSRPWNHRRPCCRLRHQGSWWPARWTQHLLCHWCQSPWLGVGLGWRLVAWSLFTSWGKGCLSLQQSGQPMLTTAPDWLPQNVSMCWFAGLSHVHTCLFQQRYAFGECDVQIRPSSTPKPAALHCYQTPHHPSFERQCFLEWHWWSLFCQIWCSLTDLSCEWHV